MKLHSFLTYHQGWFQIKPIKIKYIKGKSEIANEFNLGHFHINYYLQKWQNNVRLCHLTDNKAQLRKEYPYNVTNKAAT